jgi:lysophospholipase L1-like esterase
MRSRFVTLFCLLLACPAIHPLYAQSRKYIIAVIGSSTAQGVGATPIDSSWVNLVKHYFQGLGLIDTVYNIALGGETTYAGMPSNFIQPAGRPAPDTSTNVTKALSFNPDVVLVNFPTNDAAADYTLTETMSNLRTIYETVKAAGKIVFITTSQPRDSPLVFVQQELLKTTRDSVLTEFSGFNLNFYDPIAAADSLNINTIYNFDGTHVNNGGHQQLFQVVKAAGILSGIPLPLTALSLTAMPEGQAVALRWTVADETGPLSFVVQRSSDSKSFDDIWQLNVVTASAAPSDFSWTDNLPLPGKSFYRLKYTGNSTTTFSAIVSVDEQGVKWGIGKLIAAAGASSIQAELLSPSTKTATLTIVNTLGEKVYRQVLALNPPSVILTIPTSGWASGQYFLHLVSGQGDVATRAFLKF